jgi:hypothetical protein
LGQLLKSRQGGWARHFASFYPLYGGVWSIILTLLLRNPPYKG